MPLLKNIAQQYYLLVTQVWCLLVWVMILFSTSINAQFISPGELSKPHTFLEGISQCTSCHELRNPEITNEKCESCHTPIKVSRAQEKGFHGTEEVIEQSCASCHKEHFGLSFDLLRFDSTDFDHSTIGFVLDGAHEPLSCASCHQKVDFIQDSTLLEYQEKFELINNHDTFLGLDQDCNSCHIPDSPHGNQFADQTCSNCHNTSVWEEADLFDHNNTLFPLTGAHLEVSCEQCHQTDESLGEEIILYVGIDFESCESCHVDVHDGRLDILDGQTFSCENCHLTTDWHVFGSDFPEQQFPHEETGYALLGAHLNQTCESCHTQRTDKIISNTFKDTTIAYSFPEPISEDCSSCHVDIHKGVFEKEIYNQSCESCHTIEQWIPTTFGIDDHNKKSEFILLGAHIVTPCFACHQSSDLNTEWVFEFEDQSCNSCHQGDNPHGTVENTQGEDLASNCSNCHNSQNWSSVQSFDHEEQTGFELTGAHLETKCSSCHFEQSIGFSLLGATAMGVEMEKPTFSFELVGSSCTTCHETESPHQNQFVESFRGPACESCHTTDAFTMEFFDHDLSNFSLDGAHESVPCVSCHVTESAPNGMVFTRFYPLSSECSSCHGQ